MRVPRFTSIILWAVLVTGMFKLVYEPMYRGIFGKASYSTEAVFRVPGSAVEIVLDRRCIHLFLAEYERTLIVRIGTGEMLRRPVAVDTGGYSRMNVYQVSPTDFFLQGELSFDRYLLETSAAALTDAVLKEKPVESRFVGAFDRDENGWRFIPAHEREEQKPRMQEMSKAFRVD